MKFRIIVFFSLIGLFFVGDGVFASVVPNDEFYSKLWYLDQIQAVGAWGVSSGSSDVLVAVVDTGVDVFHEDLVDNIYLNTGEIPGDGIDNDSNGFVDDVRGWDFYDDDADVRPVEIAGGGAGVHHGTVVSGIVGAVGNNGIGVVGVNWDVSILPVRVLASDGQGRMNDVVAGIRYAVDMGADVINISFVGDFSMPKLDEALQYAYDNDVVVVVALGNDFNGGRDVDLEPIYPACSRGLSGDTVVIGVVASDSEDMRADYSNYGASCAHISAPGNNIFTTQAYGVDGGYGDGWTGTSLAAPLVSGAAALIRGVYPEASVDEIRVILQLSADPMYGGAPSGVVGALGTGRLNIDRALMIAGEIVDGVEADGLRVEVLSDGDNGVSDVADFTGGDLNEDVEKLDNVGVVGHDDNVKPLVFGGGFGDEPVVWTNGDVDDFLAYDYRFTGGVRVGVGDVDGDGEFEIVTGAGIGGGPHVRVFDMAGGLKAQFFAYDAGYSGGIFVEVGDLDGDGVDEIVVLRGDGEYVRVFSVGGELLTEFALDAEWGGLVDEDRASFTVGDVDGDGVDNIIFGGNGGRVGVFDRYGEMVYGFSAFGGVDAVGWFDVGTVLVGGVSRIGAVGSFDGEAQVRIFDPIGALVGIMSVFDGSLVSNVVFTGGGEFGDGLFGVVDIGGVSRVVGVYDVDGDQVRVILPVF